jgi:hypothetical protein
MQTDNTYKLKYSDIRRKTTLKKALMLKNIFHELFLHKSDKELLHMLSQCGHHHYGQKHTSLNAEGRIMYEYLVSHNYNPYTVYKWFLLFLTAEAVKEDIENNKLTQLRARKIVVTRRKQEEVSKSWKFIEESRKIALEVLYYV